MLGQGGIPFNENEERDILYREAKIFILGILYLRCILDIQMDMMNRPGYICIKFKRLFRGEAENMASITWRWYLKSWRWGDPPPAWLIKFYHIDDPTDNYQLWTKHQKQPHKALQNKQKVDRFKKVTYIWKIYCHRWVSPFLWCLAYLGGKKNPVFLA